MEYKDRIKYFYEHITSEHRLDEVCDYVSTDCIIRVGERHIPVGVDGMKQHMIEVRKTYPDLKMTILNQYCDGDDIISEFIMEGTHLGEWLGIRPSGKSVSIFGVNIDKVIDGKIVEHGGAANTFDALFEAGIIQPARENQ
ncbi:MAG TPA: hypothetical protein DDW34_04940 [Clostridium sp.]|nr:hypothetical protein [Clostridium sp.]